MGLFSTKAKPAGPKTLDIDTLIGQMFDRRRDALYDRVQLKAGTPFPQVPLRCFQIPVGHADPYTQRVKMFCDTNMCIAGMLPAPHEMIVKRFLLLFQPSTTEVDRNNVLANFHWEFRTMQKIRNREPALVAAATGKPEDLMENFGKGSWLNDEGNRADDSTSNIRKLGEGICWDLGESSVLLPALCYFDVMLEGWHSWQSFNLQGNMDFYIFLDGYRDVSVQ